ncbi:MAG: FAD/NAD(P)-binding protein [Candidatus Zipacnadales bacterium]
MVAEAQDLYLPEFATVLEAKPMTATERYLKVALDSGQSLGHKPGQFVEVSIIGIGEAPISISSAPSPDPTFELVVRNCGIVSGAIHRVPVGGKIGVRGPFGNGFDAEAMKGKDLLFVCGGIGLVPARSLIHYCLQHRGDYGEFTILFGCKSPGERLFVDELESWRNRSDVQLYETIDRPHPEWDGHVGVITTLFPELDITSPKDTVAIVVGPPIMYRFVIIECLNAGIDEENIVMSLERHMKCGVGKCGHCQINQKYVCQDGPVFTYAEVRHLKEAI